MPTCPRVGFAFARVGQAFKVVADHVVPLERVLAREQFRFAQLDLDLTRRIDRSCCSDTPNFAAAWRTVVAG
jgi:hypothetical protein